MISRYGPSPSDAIHASRVSFRPGGAVNPDLARHQRELEALCHRFGVRRLELFGSAAVGRDRPGESDLDFLVDFHPVLPGSYADTYFGLLEGLEALFGRPIDLVVNSAVKNPYFRESVDETKVLIFAA
jgi:predicted nucleotidyltransferase